MWTRSKFWSKVATFKCARQSLHIVLFIENSVLRWISLYLVFFCTKGTLKSINVSKIYCEIHISSYFTDPVSTLDYQINVAYQINIALRLFVKINKRSLWNKRSHVLFSRILNVNIIMYITYHWLSFFCKLVYHN